MMTPMRILIASGHPYLPQIAGGSQSNTHEMALELKKHGHDVAVLAGLSGDGWLALRSRLIMKLGRLKLVRDDMIGYPVFRAWQARDVAAEVVRQWHPDVVIAQPGSVVAIALAFKALGVPTVAYFHNVEFEDHGGDISDITGMPLLANSRYTAGAYQKEYGVNATVVPPLFQSERYTVERRGDRVLFINPHPLKGVDVALDVAARCPDLQFDFVESWTLSSAQRDHVRDRARKLGNVTLHGRTSDMRGHYGRARVVLVPSRWAETWGRVASEAHYSGIPVIATRIGGLEEAVGPGGILMAPDADGATWAVALQDLWNDSSRYSALSERAITFSQRPEIDRIHQIAQIEVVLERAIGHHTATNKVPRSASKPTNSVSRTGRA